MKILLIAIIMVFVTIAGAAQAPPPFPFTVNGTLTVDGVKLTQATIGSDYKIAIRKTDGTDFTTDKGAKAETTTLNPTDNYVISVPILASSQPGGAEPNKPAIIKVFFQNKELTVATPANGQIMIGDSDGGATYNLEVTTPCTYTSAINNSSFSAVGGNGSISISTTSLCAWNATTDVNWISFTSPVSGNGNGSANFTVVANNTINAREGNISVAGKIFKITQTGITCSYQLSSPSQSFSAGGGSGNFNVLAPSGCAWAATPSDNWITISQGSGNGNGAVSFTVAVNNSASSRSGSISVQGQTFTITQAAASCSYMLSPVSQSFSASGGSGSFSVTSPGGCAWTSTTGDSWITIAQNSSSGNGNGTVNFSIAANTGPARAGAITISGQTFTINQSSGCTYSISPTNKNFTAGVGTGSISVATVGGCPWTAVSNNDWITISSGNSGAGTGTVNFSVTANTGNNSRNGTITVGGQTFTITQESACIAAAISKQPTNQTICIGGTISFSVTATGTELSYQWRKNGAPISNAIGNTFTISSATSSDAANYDVVVTGACGSATSNTVTLTLNPATTISIQPVGPIRTVGQSVTFSVVAQGDKLTYQWRKNSVAIGTATASSYTIPAVALGDAGSYDVVVTGTCGAVTSNAAILTVNNLLPVITTLNPSSGFAGGAAFTLVVNGKDFLSGAKVLWNGAERTTRFISATRLEADIPATDLVSAGTVQITVMNPNPGGLTSNALPFSILAGYEADVSPRPNGKRNGTVTVADWVQLGRFFVGLEAVTGPQELQRADCAPRATLGDGKISIIDWVQAGRYSAGLDPVVAAGGPTTATLLASPEGDTLNAESARTVSAVNASFARGQIGSLQIQLEAQGNENAAAFSLNFDPTRLTFVDAKLGTDASGATVQVNAAQAANGKIGIALALGAGQNFVAGTRTLLNVRFIPSGGDGDTTTGVSFGDQLLTREVADVNAATVTNVSYANAAITISGKAVATVSAANYVGGEQAAESIVSAFGSQLAAFSQAAASLPLPISLGGSQVIVKDSKGAERFAPLFYASPAQINFQLPAGTAEGVATLTIFSGAGTTATGLVTIGKVAPALFSADASGTGFATGSALLVRADGTRTENNLARYDAGSGKFVGQPIDIGSSSDQVYLTLYGTGCKNRSDLTNVKVKIGGVDALVEYAGTQGFFAGLDQINVKLPVTLKGRGEVNVELLVDGKLANVVRVAIR